MGVSISVEALRGGEPVGKYAFDSDTSRTVKIGRLTSAQIKLEDPKVSRIHAVIEFSGTDAALIDMGSTGGTVVNGSKVSRVKLSDGDTIVLGDTTLVVHFGGVLADIGTLAPQQTQAPKSPSVFEDPTLVTQAAISVPAAEALAALNITPQPAAAVASGMSRTPDFDPGLSRGNTDAFRRISNERLRAAAVESRPNPHLPQEDELTRDNRVLELRYYWNESLLGMYHYVRPNQVTIGENKRTNIFLSSENLPTEEFPIIRYKDGEYLFNFTSRMEGEIETGGRLLTLGDAKTAIARNDPSLADTYQIALADDARVIMHWGGASFAMRFVAPAKVIPPPFAKNIDLHYLNAAVFSLFLHIAAVVTLLVYPHETDALKVDLFGEPDRFASLILEAPPETKKSTDLLKKMQAQVEKKKEEIKPVTEKVKPAVTAHGLESKVSVPKTTQPRNTAEDRRANVAKQFNKLFGGVGTGGGAGNLLGGGGGGSLSGTLQNVIGTAGDASAAGGLAGMGLRGSGPMTGGGLGTSRGVGGIGTTGRLGGGGTGYGAGAGGLGKGGGRSMIEFDTPTVEGSLSADVIKRVINANRNQIRYCYEVELQRHQDLEGRVLMHWIIGPNGDVIKVEVRDTSLRNDNVQNCLMGKIRHWKFPSPAGGGTVEVNYPFVFKAN